MIYKFLLLIEAFIFMVAICLVYNKQVPVIVKSMTSFENALLSAHIVGAIVILFSYFFL